MSKFEKSHIIECAKRIEELAEFGKRKLPETVKKLYVEFLAPLTPEELDLAFKSWLFKSTSFPSAEQLLECCGRSPKQRAEANWITLEMKRDKIADEVCRQHQILVSLRLTNHGNEFEAGTARRELKKRFVENYVTEWFKWWTRGEIEAGETYLDFSPKPVKLPEPEGEKITAEDFQRLKEKIAQIGSFSKPKKKFLSLEEIQELESPPPPPEPDPDDEDEIDIPF